MTLDWPHTLMLKPGLQHKLLTTSGRMHTSHYTYSSAQECYVPSNDIIKMLTINVLKNLNCSMKNRVMYQDTTRWWKHSGWTKCWNARILNTRPSSHMGGIEDFLKPVTDIKMAHTKVRWFWSQHQHHKERGCYHDTVACRQVDDKSALVRISWLLDSLFWLKLGAWEQIAAFGSFWAFSRSFKSSQVMINHGLILNSRAWAGYDTTKDRMLHCN